MFCERKQIDPFTHTTHTHQHTVVVAGSRKGQKKSKQNETKKIYCIHRATEYGEMKHTKKLKKKKLSNDGDGYIQRQNNTKYSAPREAWLIQIELNRRSALTLTRVCHVHRFCFFYFVSFPNPCPPPSSSSPLTKTSAERSHWQWHVCRYMCLLLY